MRMFRIGDKVTKTQGVNAGKTAKVVDKSFIKLDGRGVALNVSGAYNHPDWKVDVPIRYRNGTLDLVDKRFLKLLNNESMNRAKTLKEGNRISDELPQRIDEFLQEVSQFQEDGISYENIMKFGEIFNSRDVSILDNFRRNCEEAEDEELQEIQDKVVSYILKRLNQVKESKVSRTEKSTLQRIKRLEEQIGLI